MKVKSELISVKPDEMHQPDYVVHHNKVHIDLPVNRAKKCRIRIGNPVLKTERGVTLLPRDKDDRNRKYEFGLTNAVKVDYYFESEESELSAGSTFSIDIEYPLNSKVERRTFILNENEWTETEEND